MIFNRLFFSVIFIFLIVPTMVFPQAEPVANREYLTQYQQLVKPVQFNKKQLETYKNDPDFDYTEIIPQENWWTLLKDWVSRVWNKFWNWLLGSYAAEGIIAWLLKILPYLIIAGIIGFAIWLFIKLNPAKAALRKPKQAGVHLSEEEKILQSEDIPSLIQQALEQKNYRSAVRYSYLLVLKNLKTNKLIDYQTQKTNEEYLSEIEPISLKNQFKNITHLYDFIWYGNFPVTETDFKKAEYEFVRMKNLLNSTTHGNTN